MELACLGLLASGLREGEGGLRLTEFLLCFLCFLCAYKTTLLTVVSEDSDHAHCKRAKLSSIINDVFGLVRAY